MTELGSIRVASVPPLEPRRTMNPNITLKLWMFGLVQGFIWVGRFKLLARIYCWRLDPQDIRLGPQRIMAKGFVVSA